MKISTRKLASAAVVGAAYAALTLLLAPISFGLVQLRVSEALCILPAFLPCTAWGLWAGCAIANLAGGYGLPDIVFGSLATLGASLSMAAIAKGRSQPLRLGRALAVCLMPVCLERADSGRGDSLQHRRLLVRPGSERGADSRRGSRGNVRHRPAAPETPPPLRRFPPRCRELGVMAGGPELL